MLIDSHAHLGDERVYPHIDEILSRAHSSKLSHIINICTDDVSLSRGLEIHSRYPWVYNVGATPPHDVVKDGERLFPLFESHAKNGDLIAIGETGLDYFYHKETEALQKRIFIKYLHLAKELKLPIVIHCRDAFQDLFSIIDAEYGLRGGILHCFTGNKEEADELVKRGWYLSFSGIVTYKKSFELREIVKQTPVEHILIETDSPYLAPQTKRSQTNEPSFIAETATTIAELKGISLEECAQITSHNIRNAFRLL
jgi:TatD DNase family protein